MDKPTLSEAAHSLYEYLGLPRYPYYIQGVGERAISKYNDIEELVVFLNREPYHFEKSIPTQWCGFLVRSTIIGEIKIT